ncbi:Ras guanine nucleotide exchange factor [Entamoeba marina]
MSNKIHLSHFRRVFSPCRIIKVDTTPTSSPTLHSYLTQQRSYVTEQRFQITLQRTIETLEYVKRNEQVKIRKAFSEGIVIKDSNGEILKGDFLGLMNALCLNQNNVMKAFVWTHGAFSTSVELLNGFLDRYEKACDDDSKQSLLIRARIISAVKYWLENIWIFVKNNEKSIDVEFSLLLRQLKQYGMKNQEYLLAQCYERVNSGVETSVIQTQTSNEITIPPLSSLINIQPPSNAFDDVQPIEYARQITLITHEMFKRIKLYEMLMWSSGQKEMCKNIINSQKFFNGIQNHFTLMILHNHCLIDRIKIITQLTTIAEICYNYHNFDTVICIMLLFNTSALHRLKRTFDGVSEHTKKIIQKLQRLASPENNWGVLREEMNIMTRTSVVPYIGLILSDLTFTNFGNQTYNANLINFCKCRQMAKILQDIIYMHQQTYLQYFQIDVDIQARIISDAHLDGSLSDLETYELSLQTESRNISIEEKRKDGHRLQIHIISKQYLLIEIEIKDMNSSIQQIIKDSTGFQITSEALYVFYSDSNRNHSINKNSKISSIHFNPIHHQNIILSVVEKVYFLSLYFFLNNELCSTQIPFDPTQPILKIFPIVSTFCTTPVYPIAIQSNKVIGCLIPSFSLDQMNWSDTNAIYLIPLSELSVKLTYLSHDKLRFESSRFYKEFVFFSNSIRVTLVVVDVMLIIYFKESFQSVIPLEFLTVQYNAWNNTLSLSKWNDSSISTIHLTTTSPTINQFLTHICKISPYQREKLLFGVERTVLERDSNNLPKKLNVLLKSIYFSNQFLNKNYFDFSLDDISSHQFNFEQNLFVDPIAAPALLHLYLTSLNEPLISRSNARNFISFDFIDRDDRITLLRRAMEDLSDTVRPISIVIFQLFQLHFIKNHGSFPLNFAKFFFENLPLENIERILTFFFFNSDEILPSQNFIAQPNSFIHLPVTDFIPVSVVANINTFLQNYVHSSTSLSTTALLIKKKNDQIVPKVMNHENNSFVKSPRKHLIKRSGLKFDGYSSQQIQYSSFHAETSKTSTPTKTSELSPQFSRSFIAKETIMKQTDVSPPINSPHCGLTKSQSTDFILTNQSNENKHENSLKRENDENHQHNHTQPFQKHKSTTDVINSHKTIQSNDFTQSTPVLQKSKSRIQPSSRGIGHISRKFEQLSPQHP